MVNTNELTVYSLKNKLKIKPETIKNLQVTIHQNSHVRQTDRFLFVT